MAGDGQISEAQQRRYVMKTVQPYSILPCTTHPSYCLHPLFSFFLMKLQTTFFFFFTPLLFSSGLSSWSTTLGTRCDVKSRCLRICSSQRGLKNGNENAQLPWQVTGIIEIMRALYAVIILMNLVKSGFIAELKHIQGWYLNAPVSISILTGLCYLYTPNTN